MRYFFAVEECSIKYKLSRLWEGFSLTDQERKKIVLPSETLNDSRTRGKTFLLALLVAKKGVNREYLKPQ